MQKAWREGRPFARGCCWFFMEKIPQQNILHFLQMSVPSFTAFGAISRTLSSSFPLLVASFSVCFESGLMKRSVFKSRKQTGKVLITKSFFLKREESTTRSLELCLFWVYLRFYVISACSGLLGASFLMKEQEDLWAVSSGLTGWPAVNRDALINGHKKRESCVPDLCVLFLFVLFFT